MRNLAEILSKSLYYPACGLDGKPMSYFNPRYELYGIDTFIYCDYHIEKEEVINNLPTVLGYESNNIEDVAIDTLITNEYLTNFLAQRRRQYFKVVPYALIISLQRKQAFDENHGPASITLIYIGGEGISTFEGLYLANRVSPRAISIIRPGTGFGFNWTDFRKKHAPMANVIMNNPFGCPDHFLVGFEFDWSDEYELIDNPWDIYFYSNKRNLQPK